MIELRPANDRGFLRGEFKDRNGDACSIQKSSIGTEDCIWLGCDHETFHSVTGEACGARMHLTRDLAAALIPHLQRFVETGELETSE
jgi:hypothetical protein